MIIDDIKMEKLISVPSHLKTILRFHVRSPLMAPGQNAQTVNLLLQPSGWATWWAAIGLLETFLISGLAIFTTGHVLYLRFIHLDGK